MIFNNAKVPQEIIDALKEKLAVTMTKAAENGYPVKAPDIRIEDMGYGRSGECSSEFIRLNARYLLEFPEKMIAETFTHEFAHLIQHRYDLFERTSGKRRRVHDSTFFRLWEMLGGTRLTRCHDMKLENKPARRVQKQHPARCGCSGANGKHMLSPIVYNRLRQGVPYRCRTCKVALSLEAATGSDMTDDELLEQLLN